MTSLKAPLKAPLSAPLGSVSGGASATLQEQVIALFEGGTYWGGMWTPQDRTTTFQDRSATPVTAANAGDPLGTLKDISGNDNHLIAPSDAARPTLRNPSGDIWKVEWDGSATRMSYTDVEQSQPITVAVRGDDSTLLAYLWSGSNTANRTDLLTQSTYRLFAGSVLVCASGDTSVHTHLVTFNGASSEHRLDGGSITTGNAGANTSKGLNFGSYVSGSNYQDGDTYGMFAIGKELTLAEKELVESWLDSLFF